MLEAIDLSKDQGCLPWSFFFVQEKTMCQQCDEIKAIVQEWTDKQGHNRCWYYPELFRKLAKILSIKGEPKQVPRAEFERGCSQFQDEEYG